MSFLKQVFDQYSQTNPIGTKITHSSGKTYIKESTGWYNTETGKKLDYKSSLILESNFDFKIKPYDGYYIDGVKLTPEQASKFKNAFYKNGQWYSTNGGEKLTDEKVAKLNSSFHSVKDEIQKKKSEDKKAEKESPKDEPKDDAKPKSSGMILAPAPTIPGTEPSQTAPSSPAKQEEPKASKAPEVQPEPEVEEPQAQPSSEPTPEEEPAQSSTAPEPEQDTKTSTATTVPSSIPNGYVYTSGKGNKFILKNGTWINAGTKKPVNASNVNMLNRSAEKAVNDFNAGSEIKIGSTVKSNKGVEYTYNGTGFTTADGKTLSGGAAQAAYNKLLQSQKEQSSTDTANTDSPASTVSSDTTQAQPAPQAQPKPDITSGESQLGQDTTSAPSTAPQPASTTAPKAGENNPNSTVNAIGGSTGTPEVTPEPEQSSTAPESEPVQDTQGQPQSEPKDELEGLAQSIKSSKYNKQIVTLLNRGGDAELLLADILLNNEVQEAIDIINSLNSSNT